MFNNNITYQGDIAWMPKCSIALSLLLFLNCLVLEAPVFALSSRVFIQA